MTRIFYSALKQLVLLQIRNSLSYKTRSISSLRQNSKIMEGEGFMLNDIVRELEKYADPKLAENWDNVGLLVEPSGPHHVNKVLLTNDLTLPVLNEALLCKADMIISYHPPIFAPLKRITQSSWKEKIIATCLENKIAVYSPHTAWDATPGAVGDSLASAFTEFCSSTQPIIPNKDSEQIFDVMTAESNRDLLISRFGVEILGRLNVCEHNATNVEERQQLKSVVYRIITDNKTAHDISNLPFTHVTEVHQVKKALSTRVGMGRIVDLVEPGCSLTKCLELMKCYTNLSHLRLAKGLNHNLDSLIKTIALVPGSGGSLLKGVRADLFITGEMFHHDLLDAVHHNTSVILTNHSDSERPFLAKFSEFLKIKFPSVDISVSTEDSDPLQTV